MTKVTRREVVCLGSVTALAGALGGGATCAQVSATSTPASAEVDARISSILSKYGDRFDEEQKSEVRRLVAGAQQGLEAMRAYPLENSIEPATLFRVYRPPRRPSKIVPHSSEPNR